MSSESPPAPEPRPEPSTAPPATKTRDDAVASALAKLPGLPFKLQVHGPSLVLFHQWMLLNGGLLNNTPGWDAVELLLRQLVAQCYVLHRQLLLELSASEVDAAAELAATAVDPAVLATLAEAQLKVQQEALKQQALEQNLQFLKATVPPATLLKLLQASFE